MHKALHCKTRKGKLITKGMPQITKWSLKLKVQSGELGPKSYTKNWAYPDPRKKKKSEKEKSLRTIS